MKQWPLKHMNITQVGVINNQTILSSKKAQIRICKLYNNASCANNDQHSQKSNYMLLVISKENPWVILGLNVHPSYHLCA